MRTGLFYLTLLAGGLRVFCLSGYLAAQGRTVGADPAVFDAGANGGKQGEIDKEAVIAEQAGERQVAGEKQGAGRAKKADVTVNFFPDHFVHFSDGIVPVQGPEVLLENEVDEIQYRIVPQTTIAEARTRLKQLNGRRTFLVMDFSPFEKAKVKVDSLGRVTAIQVDPDTLGYDYFFQDYDSLGRLLAWQEWEFYYQRSRWNLKDTCRYYYSNGVPDSCRCVKITGWSHYYLHRYALDSLNRLLRDSVFKQTYGRAKRHAVPEKVIYYAYDEDGMLKEKRHMKHDSLLAVRERFGYDVLGNLVSYELQDWEEGQKVQKIRVYEEGKLVRLSERWMPSGKKRVFVYSYDDAGLLTSYKLKERDDSMFLVDVEYVRRSPR